MIARLNLRTHKHKWSDQKIPRKTTLKMLQLKPEKLTI